MLVMYILYLNKTFESLDKVHDLITNYGDQSFGMIIMKFAIISVAVLLSIKLP